MKNSMVLMVKCFIEHNRVSFRGLIQVEKL